MDIVGKTVSIFYEVSIADLTSVVSVDLGDKGGVLSGKWVLEEGEHLGELFLGDFEALVAIPVLEEALGI